MKDIDKIEVTANRGDEEKWRITRLERVLGYISSLADHYNNQEFLTKIKKIHDHKGELTVTWIKEPTDGEKEFFITAWESSVGDYSNNVIHEI